jgi:membrane protein DedA with SNARE-associated domain
MVVSTSSVPSRGHLALLVVPIATVTALGTLGTALTPYLAVHHPLVLLVLEARDRNLVLARHVALVPYVVVGSVRRLLTDPLFFLLGRDYGDAGVRWIEGKGGGPVVRFTERLFRAAAYPMLVVFPGAVVCTLAGEVGIPTSIFLVVVTVRTVAAVFLIRWLAGVFGPQVDAVLHFFDRFTLPATAATIVAVVLWILWDRHRQSRAKPTPDDNPPS